MRIPFASYLWRVSLAWLPIGALVWGAIIAAGAALDYARRLKEREVRDAELREQLARAELATLRARLHPHFLFNALHSIGALVRGGDNAAAVRVVAELSELLREAISRDAPDMVRLRDELAFVRRRGSAPIGCASSGICSPAWAMRWCRRSSSSHWWKMRCDTLWLRRGIRDGCVFPRDAMDVRSPST